MNVVVKTSCFIFFLLVNSAVRNVHASTEPLEVTLSWTAPQKNTDGTDLKSLKGYLVYYGEEKFSWKNILFVGDRTRVTIRDFHPGPSYYFSLRAFGSNGELSEFSSVIRWDSSAAQPTFTPDERAFRDSIQIVMSTSTPGAEIRYTDDGTEPQMTSRLYTGPVVLKETSMLRARAYKNGLGVSEEAVSTYTLEERATVFNEYYSFEAENSILTLPMLSIDDLTASGNAFVWSPEDDKGYADFVFTVLGGDYVIWARTAAGTSAPVEHNSFTLSMDGSEEYVWPIVYSVSGSPTTSWQWGLVEVACDADLSDEICSTEGLPVFALERGRHTLRVGSKGSHVRLDRFLITSDLDFNPNNDYVATAHIDDPVGWINTSSAIRVADCLRALYTFDEGFGDVIRDVSDVGSPFNLDISDVTAVRWGPGSLMVKSSVVIASKQGAGKIVRSVKKRNELTVEAWVKPALASQPGVPRIVAISEDQRTRDLALIQTKQKLQSRIRRSDDLQGQPYFSSAKGFFSSTLMHIVVTRDSAGKETFFRNGVLKNRRTTAGDLSSWEDFRLVLANGIDGKQPWLGEYYLIAIYCTALTPKEVKQNYTAGPNLGLRPDLVEPGLVMR